MGLQEGKLPFILDAFGDETENVFGSWHNANKATCSMQIQGIIHTDSGQYPVYIVVLANQRSQQLRSQPAC
jgi:hypothetical protein